MHTCFTVDILIPLFSIRDPESWGVRLSYLLPPPRTILGALARGLGRVLGFCSGEETVRGLAVREILTFALESSTFATVRPLTPIIRHPQLLRIVPAIEEGEQPIDPTRAHDAFKHDILFTNRLRLIFTPNLKQLNLVLQEHAISAVQESDLLASMQLLERIGNTESFCSPQRQRQLKAAKADTNVVNTYSPLQWIEPNISNGIISPLLVNLRLLETFSDSDYIKRKDEGVGLVRDPQIRRKKAMFCLPLSTKTSQRGRELLTPAEVVVEPKPGYAIYALADGTSMVLPW
ncbi:MAG: type I-A CRISPR-associated protein Cas5a [Candidatus Methanomethyliaceae archaeon]